MLFEGISMKRLHILSLLMLVLLSGCAKKNDQTTPRKNKKGMAMAQVDIPVAEDTVRSFFDEEIGEFVLVDDVKTEKTPVVQEKTIVAQRESLVTHNNDEEDFSWVEEEDLGCGDFDIVYYDFDKCDIRSDQEMAVNDNVKKIVEAYNDACREGQDPTVVIEGHSCSITRSRVYNLALSEKRAKTLSDKLVQAGLPRSAIKVVGRGEEYPAIVDGKPVTGSKDQQWPNRRSEIHLIYA